MLTLRTRSADESKSGALEELPELFELCELTDMITAIHTVNEAKFSNGCPFIRILKMKAQPIKAQ